MTHYRTLEVADFSDTIVVTKSYRRLAMKYHPDRNLSDSKGLYEQLFKNVQSAYDILNDPASKMGYDNTLRNPVTFSQNVHWQKPKYEPKVYIITIPFADLYTGKEYRLAAGGPSFSVPKGMHEHSTFSSTLGDLYKIQITPDKRFSRHGNDLHINLAITAIEAMFGCTVRMTHLDGKVFEFRVHDGIQYGAMVRLPKIGLCDYNDHNIKGDVFVKILILNSSAILFNDTQISKIPRRTSIIL